ncbi:MAG TPA: 4-hydroxybenzoate octaprenyltransferase [Aestuariivirgaceae bacterium]|nr:4-hydroxybenzoate octaprenyltransferase [Aestuariivirgaceae bacterium]
MSRTGTDEPVADALPRHWVDHWLPVAARPYARLARLERPIGWWLLLLPGWWSIALAQVAAGGGLPDIRLLTLFLIGAIVMRGAGCTFNDIVDRDFDARVARTRSRPIPSGKVSLHQAQAFLVLLAFIGLAILLQFNLFAIALGALSLLTIVVYPFMKRVTYWPQVFLGIAFNWGALLGWAAVHGRLDLAAIVLYLGGIAWTLAYDTIYAHQDKEDDALIGIKSTALKLGSNTPLWLACFFAAALGLVAAAGWLAGAGPLYHIGVAAAGLHALWQLARLDIDDPARCLKLFRSNREFGLLIFAAAVADSLIRTF